MGVLADFYLIVISTLIDLVVIVVIVQAVLSWLIAFDVINRHNQVVGTIWNFTHSVTRPLLRPIQSVIPPLGGVDISPIILILLLYFIDAQLTSFFMRF